MQERGNYVIRRSKASDLDSIMEIWLNSNLDVHPFVAPSYWMSHYEAVKEAISEGVTVYEKDGEIIGFIGITEGYVAGLFVNKTKRGNGIGKALLDEAKKANSSLTLHVFEQNPDALRFYEREGFVRGQRQKNIDCDSMEFCMQWER